MGDKLIMKEWIQEHLSDEAVLDKSKAKAEEDGYASLKEWLAESEGIHDAQIADVEMELEFDNFTPHDSEGGEVQEIEVEYTGSGSAMITHSKPDPIGGEPRQRRERIKFTWYSYVLVYEKDGEWVDGDAYVSSVKPL